MFHLVIGSYLSSLADLPSRMAEHQAYLEEIHKTGAFLLSGQKSTGDGCIGVAQTPTREALIDILEQDPLCKDGLIRYEVIGFVLDAQTFALTEELFLGDKRLSRLLAEDAIPIERLASV